MIQTYTIAHGARSAGSATLRSSTWFLAFEVLAKVVPLAGRKRRITADGNCWMDILDFPAHQRGGKDVLDGYS